MKIELPYPHKILWPNGRGHHMAISREKKKHKTWAHVACLGQRVKLPAGPWKIKLFATFYPKTRHPVDKDNASASLKAYQDGIAAAIGIDDKHFSEPAIHFGDPVKGGKVIIVVEAA